jgi:hypothetical protein
MHLSTLRTLESVLIYLAFVEAKIIECIAFTTTYLGHQSSPKLLSNSLELGVEISTTTLAIGKFPFWARIHAALAAPDAVFDHLPPLAVIILYALHFPTVKDVLHRFLHSTIVRSAPPRSAER